MNCRESIEQTKRGFEESFRDGTYYNKQTSDDLHLEMILRYIPVEPGIKILDLGTGSGYLAFPFARKYKQAEITGLDIVEKTLMDNQRKAEIEGINNLRFVSYDGVHFPFENNSFDIVISRYALHHFPVICDTFCEISRVLKKNGIFFLSDPTPNEDDRERFVDEFMQMKKDGHIKFYTKNEWNELGKAVDFLYVDDFETNIRFPRKKGSGSEYEDVINKYSKDIIRGYGVEITDDEVWITEKVNNLLFRKKNEGTS